MNKILSQLYHTGAEKVSSQNEISLDEISAADFLAAVDQGILDLGDYTGGEKVASEEPGDLSQYSEEELIAVLDEIDQAQNQVKTASESAIGDDSLYWREVGREMARGYQEEMGKVASDDSLDLNSLSVDEFISLGKALSQQQNY
tara:strand:- start:8193 stop:8627 length:435 start_codon:yes stop_codon:yes gene_type:complete